ncbi:MAG: tryptophan--tRNA ligase [Firmicutes bacterium]|nr:tryptophan--tRNA ligase [Bacillota bacterium]
MSNEQRKVIYSAMQPSGVPSLGNYIGALKNWVNLQNDYDCVFAIANMHAITVRQEPAQLRKKTRDLLALFLAIGIDPEKNILYIQSDVTAHAQLNWILNCYTYVGELQRMTQFKDKSAKHEENINSGLLTYPVLMASDILLYKADLVPVGEDQRQHLEITRDIAERFNNLYGEVFKVPEGFIPKVGARIMGLQNPTRKMSKSESDNENNVIYLLDDLKVIANKIKRAVTDSDTEVRYSEDKPGISNLLNIYASVTDKTIEEAEADFKGANYGTFKSAVAEAVVERIRPIQEEFARISADKAYVDSVIEQGAQKAARIANKTLSKVKKKVGFPDRPGL